MRARFALLLLLGTFFLASVCVSLEEKTSEHKCLESCKSEKDPYKRQVCQDRCKLVPESEEQHKKKHEEEEEKEHPTPRPRHEEGGRRERGRQEGEKAEEEREEEWRGQQRREDPEERERVRQREEKRREREREKREQREEDEKFQRREKKEQREEREEGQGWESDTDTESQTHNNPFHFTSNRFHTLFKNQHAHIRVLQRLDQRSRQLQNLRDYCILEFQFKPKALLLPHHADADFLLVILSGRAIVTVVNSDDRYSYNLERGDAQRIPAGTTYYLVNPDDRKTLRLVSLAIPVNYPGRFESFFLSSTEDQQSYLEGFSKDILEASFGKKFKEIKRVLFGEEGQRQEQGVIVKVSKEGIRELSRHAKSSSRKTTSSQDEPFNLRSRNPIYSNNYGKLFEITPEKNPQLRDLNIFLSSVDINQASLMLPHYNSKATLILVVNKGDANIELVALKQQQQLQETRQVRRYRAEVSEGDILIIPSGYPIVVNATSNLNLLVFGINAENNQRNFLAGEKDNVLRQIHRQVKDLAFPGSAEDVEQLIQNLSESYFVNAQPRREQEGKEERKGPLSSIFNAF